MTNTFRQFILKNFTLRPLAIFSACPFICNKICTISLIISLYLDLYFNIILYAHDYYTRTELNIFFNFIHNCDNSYTSNHEIYSPGKIQICVQQKIQSHHLKLYHLWYGSYNFSNYKSICYQLYQLEISCSNCSI